MWRKYAGSFTPKRRQKSFSSGTIDDSGSDDEEEEEEEDTHSGHLPPNQSVRQRNSSNDNSEPPRNGGGVVAPNQRHHCHQSAPSESVVVADCPTRRDSTSSKASSSSSSRKRGDSTRRKERSSASSSAASRSVERPLGTGSLTTTKANFVRKRTPNVSRSNTASSNASPVGQQQTSVTTLRKPTSFHQLTTKPNMADNSEETASVETPNLSAGTTTVHNPNTVMFERDSSSSRPTPEMPSTDGIEYPRAASWSSSTVAEIMRDPLGRQVFRCFLFESLAEENLLFIESVEQLKKEKVPEKIRTGIESLLESYGSYINLSSVAMSKLREASQSASPDIKCLDLAHKEISKLLENDQFPRFRRSKIYLSYLEKLLPRSYAEKWMTSFDALLGNQVGRHHFRQYLFSVHAEENLRFWESVVEFRGLKNKSTAMLNMGRNIQQQFLREGAHNEVFLPFGLRQKIEKRIKEKDVDETLFDEAVKHVEQILKNDPYVRFLQSREYNSLLAKLH